MINGERQSWVVCHSPSAQVNMVWCLVAEFVTALVVPRGGYGIYCTQPCAASRYTIVLFPEHLFPPLHPIPLERKDVSANNSFSSCRRLDKQAPPLIT